MYEIISFEKIQMFANIYLGKDDKDFLFNPAIGISNKNMNIKDIPENYNNPKIIFCYTNRLIDLSEKLNNFKNPFILISGNDDKNIVDTEIKFIKILEHPIIIKWFSQNLCMEHNKLHFLPIGIANNQWKHGNINELEKIINNNIKKNKDIYFNFNINTNVNKRYYCFFVYNKFIPFLNEIDPIENFKRLAEYKFCICPEGNGIDTHRLWECWYLKVIPIVLKNDFYEILMKKINLPIIILNKWEDLLHMNLIYNFENNYEKHLDLKYYKELIIT